MFRNLGRTLSLLREFRGLSQVALAREAGIGKSQLSKYEGGKEYPKLESLEKILTALRVTVHQFNYVFYLVDSSAALVEKGSGALLRPLLLTEATDKALFQVLTDMVALSRSLFEEQLLRPPRGKR